MVSALILNTSNRSLVCSAVCTETTSTRAPELAWPSVRKSWSVMEGESGLNRNSGEGLIFDSHYRIALDNREDDPFHAPYILLAEDSPADVELLRMALEEHGVSCELFVAGDGEKAFSVIRAIDSGVMACPDLAIIDLNLPKKSGREVLHYLRSCPAFHDVTVVILSSSR